MKIKTGSVKRLWKEHNLYRQEALQFKVKYDKLVAEGADEWDIKNAKKVLEEGERMIPDSENRLAKAVIELRELVVYARTVPAFKDDADLTAAETQLQEANV
ncbi:tubulin-specific chaperone A [Ceratobasidium sp. AG-Ba]|nr:tubulin-specific chaperone A [Ceratobasidium sp. AG-Ba]